MSSKSTVGVNSRLNRRPSFWKTPLPRNPGQSFGKKRNYSQITEAQPNAAETASPSKRRRILSDSEVVSLAKKGRFNPSSIILAVEDENGFCWFKRKKGREALTEKDDDGVLRELSKTELAERQQTNGAHQAQSDKPGTVEQSGGTRNVHRSMMSKVAKSRRFTAPAAVLRQIAEQSELEDVDHGQNAKEEENAERKRKKKRRIKKKKKVICYETKREVVRKKVRRKKRVLRKKNFNKITIKMTTAFAEVTLPDFPPPAMSLAVRRWPSGNDPVAAVQSVQLSLIESFVVPLTVCFGEKGRLCFITRSVLQWLMELRDGVEAMALAADVEVVRVPISSAVTAGGHHHNGRALMAPNEEHEAKETETATKATRAAPKEDDGSNLDDEVAFYEHQLSMLQQFGDRLCGEMAFTERIQSDLKDDEFLRGHFDFDSNLEADPEAEEVTASQIDGRFVDDMVSSIDALYSEFAADLHGIGFAQKRFEKELLRREREQEAAARLYVREREEEWPLDTDEDTLTGDRMIFSNFVASNKDNDFTEDDTMHCIRYLKDHDSVMDDIED